MSALGDTDLETGVIFEASRQVEGELDFVPTDQQLVQQPRRLRMASTTWKRCIIAS